MVTKIIGLKQFRQNISSYTKEAGSGNIRFIVMKKNIPVLDIRGISETEFVLETLSKDISKAREDVKKGRTVSQESIMKEFGLA